MENMGKDQLKKNEHKKYHGEDIGCVNLDILND